MANNKVLSIKNIANQTIKFEVVAGVIIKDKKVLMCRSRGNEHYYCPGGKLEAGESYEQAMIRECKEEIDIDLIPDSIQKFSRFEADAYGFKEPRIVIMNCYQFDFTGEIKACGEINDIIWCSSKDAERLAPAGKVLLAELKEKALIE